MDRSVRFCTRAGEGRHFGYDSGPDVCKAFMRALRIELRKEGASIHALSPRQIISDRVLIESVLARLGWTQCEHLAFSAERVKSYAINNTWFLTVSDIGILTYLGENRITEQSVTDLLFRVFGLHFKFTGTSWYSYTSAVVEGCSLILSTYTGGQIVGRNRVVVDGIMYVLRKQGDVFTVRVHAMYPATAKVI